MCQTFIVCPLRDVLDTLISYQILRTLCVEVVSDLENILRLHIEHHGAMTRLKRHINGLFNMK